MDNEKLHQDFESYLIDVGLRQTKQRRVILDAILNSGRHVDAETIAQEAKKIDQSIGVATVYRTLQLMTEAGILEERRFEKDRVKFEIIDPNHEHHDHLICTACGNIVEFFNEEVEELQEKIAKESGFKLTHHRMELFGTCKICSRSNGSKNKSPSKKKN